MTPEPKPPETYSRKITSQSPQRKLKSAEEELLERSFPKDLPGKLKSTIIKRILQNLPKNPIQREAALDKISRAFSNLPFKKELKTAVFKALTNPDIAKLFTKDPDKLIFYFKKIAEAADYYARNDAFQALTNPNIAKLFTQYPDKFVGIAQGAGWNTPDAFQALTIPEVAKLFSQYPDKFVGIAQGAGDYTHKAFQALTNPNIAKLFTQYPDKFVGIAQGAGWNTPDAFQALTNPNIAKLFSQYPDKFVEIAKMARRGTDYAFQALTNPNIAKLFSQYPDKFVGIAQGAGWNTPDAFQALTNPNIAKLFSQYPDKFVEIAKMARRGTDYAFQALTNPNIAKLFTQYPDKFVGIAQGAGYHTGNAFQALTIPEVAKLFSQYPDKFVGIAQGAGYHTGNAFQALTNPNIAKLFTKDPDKLIFYFKKIAEAVGDYTGNAFQALTNPNIAKLFTKDPDKLIFYFKKVIKVAKKGAYYTFKSLAIPDIAKLFTKDPDKLISYFKKIAEVGRKSAYYTYPIHPDMMMGAYYTFKSLAIPDIAKLFIKDPDKLIFYFKKVIKVAKKGAYYTFKSLAIPEVAKLFIKYAKGEIKPISFYAPLIGSTYSYAIELGRPLDDLHDRPKKRIKYLNSLKDYEVLGLLLSNPSLFYTSTNHLLFDRLQRNLRGKKLTTYLKELGIWDNTPLMLNLLFRAANYGRLFGGSKPLFKPSESKEVLDLMFEPLHSQKFDSKYYYLLANTIENLTYIKRSSSILPYIEKVLKDELSKSKGAKKEAISYLLRFVEDPNMRKETELNLKKFTDNGKLTIVQVFKEGDTTGKGSDHWHLTIKDFTKSWMHNKVIKIDDKNYKIETKDFIMLLHLGDSENNEKYTQEVLKKYKNVILTFRGHSYSLESSIPTDIFKNKNSGHVLFIPGSCGSAGSIPLYLSNANPKLDITFIANTSTGRGQVTNALLYYMIKLYKQGWHGPFRELVSRYAAESINLQGGDPATLKYNSLGERLISELNKVNVLNSFNQ